MSPRKVTEKLTTTNPELCQEWDYNKNGDLTPGDMYPGDVISVVINGMFKYIIELMEKAAPAVRIGSSFPESMIWLQQIQNWLQSGIRH